MVQRYLENSVTDRQPLVIRDAVCLQIFDYRGMFNY